MRKRVSIIHERSAGAVVFRSSGDASRQYLLLRYGAGHWGFPKGHVEPGESDLDAARREVMEETAIPPESQRFLDGFREDVVYTFQRGRTRVKKKVLLFLVEATDAEVKISHEHTAFAWLPFQEAVHRLTFEGPRRTLENAEAFLAQLEAREA